MTSEKPHSLLPSFWKTTPASPEPPKEATIMTTVSLKVKDLLRTLGSLEIPVHEGAHLAEKYVTLTVPLGIFALYMLYQKAFKRYPSVQHLPASIFLNKRKTLLRGKVTSVGDGDNFRFYHLPPLYLFRVPTTRKGRCSNTVVDNLMT
jgi:hypothetical protein